MDVNMQLEIDVRSSQWLKASVSMARDTTVYLLGIASYISIIALGLEDAVPFNPTQAVKLWMAAFPVYKTICCVESKDIVKQRLWLTYWVLFASLYITENYALKQNLPTWYSWFHAIVLQLSMIEMTVVRSSTEPGVGGVAFVYWLVRPFLMALIRTVKTMLRIPIGLLGILVEQDDNCRDTYSKHSSTLKKCGENTESSYSISDTVRTSRRKAGSSNNSRLSSRKTPTISIEQHPHPEDNTTVQTSESELQMEIIEANEIPLYESPKPTDRLESKNINTVDAATSVQTQHDYEHETQKAEMNDAAISAQTVVSEEVRIVSSISTIDPLQDLRSMSTLSSEGNANSDSF